MRPPEMPDKKSIDYDIYIEGKMLQAMKINEFRPRESDREIYKLAYMGGFANGYFHAFKEVDEMFYPTPKVEEYKFLTTEEILTFALQIPEQRLHPSFCHKNKSGDIVAYCFESHLSCFTTGKRYDFINGIEGKWIDGSFSTRALHFLLGDDVNYRTDMVGRVERGEHPGYEEGTQKERLIKLLNDMIKAGY